MLVRPLSKIGRLNFWLVAEIEMKKVQVCLIFSKRKYTLPDPSFLHSSLFLLICLSLYLMMHNGGKGSHESEKLCIQV